MRLANRLHLLMTFYNLFRFISGTYILVVKLVVDVQDLVPLEDGHVPGRGNLDRHDTVLVEAVDIKLSKPCYKFTTLTFLYDIKYHSLFLE